MIPSARDGRERGLGRLIVVLSLTRIGVVREERPIGFLPGRDPSLEISETVSRVIDWVDAVVEFPPPGEDRLRLIWQDTWEGMVSTWASRGLALKVEEKVIARVLGLVAEGGTPVPTLLNWLREDVPLALERAWPRSSGEAEAWLELDEEDGVFIRIPQR